MEAVAWSAIGLLGAFVGAMLTLYPRLTARIDEARRDLGGRIDRLETRMDTGHTDLGARVDALTSRVDTMNARLDSHLERHAG